MMTGATVARGVDAAIGGSVEPDDPQLAGVRRRSPSPCVCAVAKRAIVAAGTTARGVPQPWPLMYPVRGCMRGKGSKTQSLVMPNLNTRSVAVSVCGSAGVHRSNLGMSYEPPSLRMTYAVKKKYSPTTTPARPIRFAQIMAQTKQI